MGLTPDGIQPFNKILKKKKKMTVLKLRGWAVFVGQGQMNFGNSITEILHFFFAEFSFFFPPVTTSLKFFFFSIISLSSLFFVRIWVTVLPKFASPLILSNKFEQYLYHK